MNQFKSFMFYTAGTPPDLGSVMLKDPVLFSPLVRKV